MKWEVIVVSNPVLEVRNSYCKLHDFDEKTLEIIDYALSYENDIEAEKVYLLSQLRINKTNREHAKNKEQLRKYQKQYYALKGNLEKLEESQFVHWLQDETFPTGHLQIVKELLHATETDYELKDLRAQPERDILLRWTWLNENQS